MLFKQLFDQETWTYTYLIADQVSKDAVLIDPVNTHIDEYIDLLNTHGLQLKYTLETHVHADHITASGLLRQRLGAQTGVSGLCGAESADIQIQDGDIFKFAGDEQIKVIATPGHTRGSISFLWRDRVFTGDSLLIGGCGRTDFQGGDAGALYDCITQRLFTLPDETLVYPGHDYQQRWVSSIKQERTTNPRLAGKTREQFIEIMNNLNLPKPRLIDEAVPANRYCGLDENERQDAVTLRDETLPVRATTKTEDMVDAAKQRIVEIDVAKSKQLLAEGNIVLIDTREESEYAAGHIDGAILLPRGMLEFKIGSLPELADKSKAVLIYCRLGNRSALAAQTLQQLGYTNVLSMAGGFEAWKKNPYFVSQGSK
ncbi:MAG: rhodanese-like domain-containing protein [Methylobacter tundripaludum]|uniref:Glyoxylase-like metal-dependent hydrolase (Beta-lactamase superfamily II) n=1 Tax=Methylobacter tundripaludum TaxID=173365 RepID=A0A2S6GJT3_9GAMM|nr:MBL fold metallo-hydrolase [Methylobacter tundripaludum]MCK9637348.1 rhodanese-like domain-containing protein [Methylobacter tundripaludum]PPK65492.1 glyoxylase-like metal-dependent hydrolase (beta-lactamase superfamily II) [Methylobacter tundripaludum]